VLTAPCPRCGGQIRETYKKFQCGNCDYALWKIVAGRQFEPAEIDTLLTEGQIGPLTGFRNKMGRTFAAAIKLNDKMEPEFDFGQDKADDAERRAGRLLRPGTAWANARSAPPMSTSMAPPMSAKSRSARPRPATSARARSSCSSRSIRNR
jgi:hypothetical protein